MLIKPAAESLAATCTSYRDRLAALEEHHVKNEYGLEMQSEAQGKYTAPQAQGTGLTRVGFTYGIT
jgi:hypothetical protein